MIISQHQADKFNHAMDEILAACYNLGLTKSKVVPKLKAGQEITAEQAEHFYQIELYAGSDLSTIADELHHEAKEPTIESEDLCIVPGHRWNIDTGQWDRI